MNMIEKLRGMAEEGIWALELNAAADHIAELEARTPAAIESIASNHDAMIILTQGYPREAVIKVVDAHTARQVAAAAPVVAEGLTPERIHKLWYRSACAESHGTRECIEHFAKSVEADLLAAHPVAGSPAEATVVPMCESCDDEAARLPDGSFGPCGACLSDETPAAAEPMSASVSSLRSDSEAQGHVSEGEYSKAVRQEIKRRYAKPCAVMEGAVLLTYSTEDIKSAQFGAKLDVNECAVWFLERSEAGYAK